MRRNGGHVPEWMLLALSLVCSCAAGTPISSDRAGFRFPADTFSFANELVWEYKIDPATRSASSHAREQRPEFALRCGAMVKAARQFYAAARFDSSAEVVDAAIYEQLVREVLDTDPRHPPKKRVVIPGYRDLREFSEAYPSLFKGAMAGPWLTYLQRGNWRMIFPFSAAEEQSLAQRLLDELAHGWPPIVHVLRFPERTINHLVVVFDAEETPAEIRFHTYDPNDATRPVELTYDRGARMFSYAATSFFPGGPVRAYEVYDGWLY